MKVLIIHNFGVGLFENLVWSSIAYTELYNPCKELYIPYKEVMYSI